MGWGRGEERCYSLADHRLNSSSWFKNIACISSYENDTVQNHNGQTSTYRGLWDEYPSFTIDQWLQILLETDQTRCNTNHNVQVHRHINFREIKMVQYLIFCHWSQASANRKQRHFGSIWYVWKLCTKQLDLYAVILNTNKGKCTHSLLTLILSIILSRDLKQQNFI